MSFNRVIILAISSLFVLGIIYLIGRYNPISMEFIINQHGSIKNLIDEQPLFSMLGTILLVTLVVSIMGPVTPLCIFSGFYFGLFQGLLISIIGEISGAVVVFFYGRYLFKEYFLNMLGQRFNKFKSGFNNNAISYLLFIRIVGGIPFGIQNIFPAVLDMKFRDYFIATLFGVLPWAYILVSIGYGIGNIVDAKEFSSSMFLKMGYILPVVLMAILVMLPVVYRLIKKRF